MVRLAAAPPAVDAVGMTSAQSSQSVAANDEAVPFSPDTVAPARIQLGAAEFAAHEQELARLRDLRDRKPAEQLRAAPASWPPTSPRRSPTSTKSGP
jgi:hypothetical protein